MYYYEVPENVINNFRKGLKLYKEGFSGNGLVEKTIDEAHSIVLHRRVTEEKLKRMRAWFARHDKAGYKRIVNPPSPGYVAFLLWGGSEGRAFANRVLKDE